MFGNRRGYPTPQPKGKRVNPSKHVNHGKSGQMNLKNRGIEKYGGYTEVERLLELFKIARDIKAKKVTLDLEEYPDDLEILIGALEYAKTKHDGKERQDRQRQISGT